MIFISRNEHYVKRAQLQLARYLTKRDTLTRMASTPPDDNLLTALHKDLQRLLEAGRKNPNTPVKQHLYAVIDHAALLLRQDDGRVPDPCLDALGRAQYAASQNNISDTVEHVRTALFIVDDDAAEILSDLEGL